MKYWDADRFEQILYLPGHCAAAWGVDISPEGAFCVSVGGDRTLRVWRRTDEQVFVEEERERALEAQIDEETERTASQVINSGSGVEPTTATTAESAKVSFRFSPCPGRTKIEYRAANGLLKRSI